MAWRERDVPWHDTTVEYCDVTGRLLPHRYWAFEADGVEVRAAKPEFEQLYRRLRAARETGPEEPRREVR